MTKDDIGDRGEALLRLLLTGFGGRTQPFFRPRFLGEKYPTFDFIVEVVDRPEFFFFVQVKATSNGYTAKEKRLKVQLKQAVVDRMVACPAPAYLIGIDVTSGNESGYILSVNEPRGPVASLTTKHRIDGPVLKKLRDEVVGYWSGRDSVLKGSTFCE